MLTVANLPMIIAVMSVVSNLMVEIWVEVALEYGATYFREWYTDERVIQQAGCFLSEPETLTGMQSMLANRDPQTIECIRGFYEGIGVVGL